MKTKLNSGDVYQIKKDEFNNNNDKGLILIIQVE